MSKAILGAGNSESNAAPDPYDLASLQLTQDFLETAGVKKHLRTVPVQARAEAAGVPLTGRT